jgi:hypothetical protein
MDRKENVMHERSRTIRLVGIALIAVALGASSSGWAKVGGSGGDNQRVSITSARAPKPTQKASRKLVPLGGDCFVFVINGRRSIPMC